MLACTRLLLAALLALLLGPIAPPSARLYAVPPMDAVGAAAQFRHLFGLRAGRSTAHRQPLRLHRRNPTNYTDPTGLSHCSQQTIAELAFATGAAVFAYIAGLVALGVVAPALVVALFIKHFAALAQLLSRNPTVRLPRGVTRLRRNP